MEARANFKPIAGRNGRAYPNQDSPNSLHELRPMSELTDDACIMILQAVPSDRERAKQASAVLFARYDCRLKCFLHGKYPTLREQDREEICQETWVQVLQSVVGNFKGTKFQAWLFTICRHKAIDFMRRPRTPEPIADPPTPSKGHVYEIEFREQLRSCLSKLPEKHRAVTQGIFELETFETISQFTKIAVTRLYQIKHEIRALLLTCMEMR